MAEVGPPDDLRPLRVLVAARSLVLERPREHLAYGILAVLVGGLLLVPALSWVLVQALGAASGGSVVNVAIADLVLQPTGILLFVLWATFVGLVAVFVTAGHAYVAAATGEGRTARLPAVARRVVADLVRVPGIGGLKIALLAFLALPLVGAVTGALAGLLLVPLGAGGDLVDIVPRGLPVPLWTVAAAMVVLFLLSAWLYVRWSLAVPILVLEGASLTAAVRASVRRVRGRFWAVAAAHALHHASVALLLTGGVALLGLAGRPAARALLATSTRGATLALAALVVLAAAAAGAILVLANARLVALTVVHHRRLGGHVDLARLSGPASSGGRRRPVLVLGAVLLAFALATALAVPRVDEELGRAARPTRITAHRGSSIAAPENTLAAIRQAIEDRADAAEIDVQQAADGGIVVLHDANLGRLAGVDRNVWELTTAELAALDVGSHHSPAFAGERVPTLADAVRTAGEQIHLNIELKAHGHETDAFVAEVVAVLARERFLERCILTSLEADLIRRVREVEPALRIGVIITAKIGSASDLDVDLYSVQPLIATTGFIRRAHRQGREVHVWTVNDARDVVTFADRAADAIITDTPRLAREVLDARTAADGLAAAVHRLLERD